MNYIIQVYKESGKYYISYFDIPENFMLLCDYPDGALIFIDKQRARDSVKQLRNNKEYKKFSFQIIDEQ